MLIAGTVDSFNSTQYLQNLAAIFDVSAKDIELVSITAASIHVTASISFKDEESAALGLRTANALSAVDLSRLLGVGVEAVFRPVVTIAIIEAPSPPPPSPPPPSFPPRFPPPPSPPPPSPAFFILPEEAGLTSFVRDTLGVPPPLPTIFVGCVLVVTAASIFAQYQKYRRRVRLAVEMRVGATKVIQAHSRRMLATRNAEQQKLKAHMELEWKTALALQLASRQFLRRLRTKREHRQLVEAAVTIQCAYRGYLFRRYVRWVRVAAAIHIQSAVRSWFGRVRTALRVARFRWIKVATGVSNAKFHKEHMAILWRAFTDAVLEARERSDTRGVWGSVSDGFSSLVRPVISWGQNTSDLPPQSVLPKHVALCLLRLPLVRTNAQKASKLNISPALIRTIKRSDEMYSRLQTQHGSPPRWSRRVLTMPPTEMRAWLGTNGQPAGYTQRGVVDVLRRHSQLPRSMSQHSRPAQNRSTPLMQRAATLKPLHAFSPKCSTPPCKQPTSTSKQVYPSSSKQSTPTASERRAPSAKRVVADWSASRQAVRTPTCHSKDNRQPRLQPVLPLRPLLPSNLSAAMHNYQRALINEMTSPPSHRSELPHIRGRVGETQPFFTQSRIHPVPSANDVRIRGAATPSPTRPPAPMPATCMASQEVTEETVPYMHGTLQLGAQISRVRAEGEAVMYRQSDGILLQARVLAVHHNVAGLYYTVLCDGDELQVSGEWLMDMDPAAIRSRDHPMPRIPLLVPGSGNVPDQKSARSTRSSNQLQGSFQTSTSFVPRILSGQLSSRRHLISDAPLSESTKDMPDSSRRRSTSSTQPRDRMEELLNPAGHAALTTSCVPAATTLEQLEVLSTPIHQERAAQAAWARGTYGLTTSPFRSPSLHAGTPRGVVHSTQLPCLNLPKTQSGSSFHQSVSGVAAVDSGTALGVPGQASVRRGIFPSSPHSSCRSISACVPFPFPSALVAGASARTGTSSDRSASHSFAQIPADQILRDYSSSPRSSYPRRPASLTDHTASGSFAPKARCDSFRPDADNAAHQTCRCHSDRNEHVVHV